MDFGSSGRDGPGLSSSPSSSSSSPQYKPGGLIGVPAGQTGGLSSAIYDGPDTKLELMNSSPKNDDVSGPASQRASASAVEKEHMFDKVVTPSDVGKLNRLVIPKQHAEKYFPLDSSTNEKGLLLNFEDRNGKPWRFRYSYWNSSQSYVMTKGWSRFVKEKKLDAGDVVSFQRGVGDKDRLFIDWRRRPDAPDQYHHHHHHHHGHGQMFHHGVGPGAFSFGGRSVPWPSPASLMRPPPQRDGAGHHMQYMPPPPAAAMGYGGISAFNHHSIPYNRNSYGGGGGVGGGAVSGASFAFGGQIPSAGGPIFYLRSPAAGAGPQFEAAAVAGNRGDGMVFDSVPVGHHGKGAAEAEAVGGKRLRLFGVNMECSPMTSSEGNEECEVLSSTTSTISSSSPSSINAANSHHHHHHHPLQLRLYNGTPIGGISTVDYLNKGKASMTTLNFDI